MKRASLEEVLAFANKVRAAGGANPLDALMPATPEDSTQCLIARNLNFSCEVSGAAASGDYVWNSLKYESGEAAWFMFVKDKTVLDKIAAALDLEIEYVRHSSDHPTAAVRLPESIGKVAYAFDMWWTEPEYYSELTPYVDESYRESQDFETE